MIKGYILDENNNPVETDMYAAGLWKQCNFERCIVKRTDLGHVEVSTVFTGINYRPHREGPPIVFETMTFGIQLGGQGIRCCTWQEAVEQHEEICDHVRQHLLAQ